MSCSLPLIEDDPGRDSRRSVRVLFTSDTHLGFDLPSRPRVERRRRGDDFFSNFERVLAPVFEKKVDIFLHGGDLSFRSKVPAWLADLVFQRLADIADTGTPVFIVPGNHERSAMPRSLFLTHPNIRVFESPTTFTVEKNGVTASLAGFPYTSSLRSSFPSLLESTRIQEAPPGVRLLCMHQLVEGATVGPGDFTFRSGEDVLPASQIPGHVAAVLSGHVHRFQVLEKDLKRRPLPAPVLYPGSIERTSFAEKDELKGFLLLELSPCEQRGGQLKKWEFQQLPARPMIGLELEVDGVTPSGLEKRLKERLLTLPPDSVVRIHLPSDPPAELLPVLGAESIRALSPPGMNVAVAWPRVRFRHGRALPGVPARVPTAG
ncbi:MAG: hypothetical protein DIJKHBIC_00234 [Thermoanaerobaculia bacterium]|nr:hypothetical protein [Thermoanaerobaculia bacterium]